MIELSYIDNWILNDGITKGGFTMTNSIDWFFYKGQRALGYDNNTGRHVIGTVNGLTVTVTATYKEYIDAVNEITNWTISRKQPVGKEIIMDINNYSYSPTMLDNAESKEYQNTSVCLNDCVCWEICTGLLIDCPKSSQYKNK